MGDQHRFSSRAFELWAVCFGMYLIVLPKSLHDFTNTMPDDVSDDQGLGSWKGLTLSEEKHAK